MNILIADDEKGIRKGLENLFKRHDYRVFSAEDSDSALKHIREADIHLALIDIRLGDSDGVHLLQEILAINADIICLMITGFGSIGNAVEAMRCGASDYLLKPLDNEYILQTVQSRLEMRQLRLENSFLKEEQKARLQSFRFQTENPAMQKIMDVADKVKNTDTTVLITGESGTGKEAVCRYIHYSSNRGEKAFVGVNCAALSDTLLLSELFGHEKGAFTGALEQKKGKFEMADQGTLFLDEIGDMPLEAQSKLLRVLEEGEFERVGGNTSVRVNIRIMAATNQNLRKLMEEKRFREDLYYRLNVICLDLPPLRDRKEDLPLLAGYFRQMYNSKFRKETPAFSREDHEKMKAYPWPGNIRELRNTVNQAVLLSDSTELLLPVPGPVSRAQEPQGILVKAAESGNLQARIQALVDQQEKAIIEEILNKHKFNRTTAAEELGITRKTLFNKMSKYGLM